MRLKLDEQRKHQYDDPGVDADRLFQDTYEHQGTELDDCSACCDARYIISRSARGEGAKRSVDNPSVHFGNIASSNQLQISAVERNRVRREHDAICFEMEAAGNKGWQNYAAATAAAARSTEQPPPQQTASTQNNTFGNSRDSIQAGIINGNIHDAMASATSTATFGNANRSIQAHTINGSVEFHVPSGYESTLGRLPQAADAPFNSYVKQDEPACLPGTRVDLLHEIYSWVDGTDERCIFWLSGLAGTGNELLLLARGGDVGHAGKFVTSIAVQLAHSVPAVRQLISDAVAKRSDIVSQALGDQWQHLVCSPLSELRESEQGPETYVVVVDALDECDSDSNIRIIVQLLAKVPSSITGVRLRVLLTSRPEVPIWHGFSQIPGEHQDFALHRVSPLIINDDIRLFLEHEFRLIKENRRLRTDWPGATVIAQLVQSASRLFIWAATACRFIEKGDVNFWVDEISAHKKLASCCLELMSATGGLRQDMCSLSKPGTLRGEIREEAVASGLPPELQYACRYWVEHVERSHPSITDGDVVHIFLQMHLLHWLEAMSLMGETGQCVRLLARLQALIASPTSGCAGFLRDANRFVLRFCSVLAEAPLQVYSSALVFAPERSVVRRAFVDQVAQEVQMVSDRDTDWDACRSVLEGHRSGVTAVVFSPDGQLVASASLDNTVRVWETATGTCRSVLEGHRSDVTAVVFSPDGQLVASASWDTTVRVWETATGTCRTVLEGQSSFINHLTFSPDGRVLRTNKGDIPLPPGLSRCHLSGRKNILRSSQ
ncbi:hypothetical protein EJ07DRAFT_186712 [Lizonia empirigonia]|nr:hypothetical protein EJ07DRAFT_186712 [Lizonia empirigonia]